MLNTILQLDFVTNGQIRWKALPGNEVIDLRRGRAIVRIGATRIVAPDPVKPNSDELGAGCCFKLLRSDYYGIMVEVAPNDVRWSYVARRRRDGRFVVVGDVSIWEPWELPEDYEWEVRDDRQYGN